MGHNFLDTEIKQIVDRSTYIVTCRDIDLIPSPPYCCWLWRVSGNTANLTLIFLGHMCLEYDNGTSGLHFGVWGGKSPLLSIEV